MNRTSEFNFNRSAGIKMPVNWPLLGKQVRPGRLQFVRNGLIPERIAGMLMAYRAKINPEGRSLKGVYGAPASDISSVLLATDADEVYMADTRQISVPELRRALENNRKMDPLKRELFGNAVTGKKRECYWNENHFNSLAEPLIAFELRSLGVKSESVKIGIDSAGNVIVRFWWAYPKAKPRQRVFTYVKVEDITRPDTYPQLLKRLTQHREIDFYFQKSASGLMLHMEGYMNVIADAVSGFVLISPTVPNIHDLGLKDRLGTIMGEGFVLDDEVNKAYAGYFENPQNWMDKLQPYSWYLEYWKRKAF